MEKLFNMLIEARRKYKLFTLEKCASDIGCTYQTVRNFEMGKTANVEVVLYYISKVLKMSEYSIGIICKNLYGDDVDEHIITQTELELEAVRDSIIVMLTILY